MRVVLVLLSCPCLHATLCVTLPKTFVQAHEQMLCQKVNKSHLYWFQWLSTWCMTCIQKLISSHLCKKFFSLGIFTIKRYKNVPLGFIMVVCLPPEINSITTDEMFMKIVIRKLYQHFSRHYNLGKKQHTLLWRPTCISVFIFLITQNIYCINKL
jgi:hypothetical protein